MSDATMLKALEELQDDWEQRETPSPSTVGTCLRRQWFVARKISPTERVAPSSILSMERGKALEPLIHELCRREGYAVSPSVALPQHACEAISCKRAQVDAILVKDGHWRLLEVKVLGMWGYRFLRDKGMMEAHPQYYTQVHLYMAALARVMPENWPADPCYFVAVSADSTAQTWYENRLKKLEPDDPARLPPLFTLNIPYESHFANVAINRAGIITELVAKTGQASSVPRDANPVSDNFPCNWCGYKKRCLEAG